MSNYVPGEGPAGAPIMLIGEAPGEQEDALCRPFIGGSGQLLNSMLAAVGIDRFRDCYVTNVVKRRPPANNFEVMYEDGKKKNQPSRELQTAWTELHAEIKSHQPNIIVPLGAEALRAVTGRRSIEHWRGSLLQTPHGKCCATYHPAFILRQYTARTTCELDLRRAKAESETRELILPTHQFEIDPSFERVMSYLGHHPDKLAFDIETSGPFVRCLGLSSRRDHAICIPFMSTPYHPIESSRIIFNQPTTPQRNSHWSPKEEHTILSALDSLFRDKSVKKIAQNLPFDALVIARDFGIDTADIFWLDTMVVQHTIYAELPKGLDYLASVYTRVPYYSDFDAAVDRQTWTYNCYDAACTLEIAEVLEYELKESRQEEFYFNHIQPGLLSYTRAETRGCLIDEVARKPVREETAARLLQLDASIKAAGTGAMTNPRSPKQIKEFLYRELNLPAQYNRKTGKETSDKKARIKLMEKFPEHAEIIRAIDEYSLTQYLMTSLLARKLGTDGRIRTHYNMAKTVTGRLASSEPLFDIGTNLQNVRRGPMRRFFVPSPGWSFIKADLSQAEFRIVVWKARIRRIIDKYLSDPDYDVHKFVASLIFSKKESEVSKVERSTAKNGVYGGQYGMRDNTAAATYGLPLQTARFVLSRFHDIFPEIRSAFWSEIEAELRSTRTITNPLERIRIFFDRLDDEMFRAARSHYAQSTVGDLITRAWALADDLWDEHEAFPLLQVHDEIVVECRTELVPVYAERLRRLMEYPLEIAGTPEPLVIPAEVSFGPNWAETTLIRRP